MSKKYRKRSRSRSDSYDRKHDSRRSDRHRDRYEKSDSRRYKDDYRSSHDKNYRKPDERSSRDQRKNFRFDSPPKDDDVTKPGLV